MNGPEKAIILLVDDRPDGILALQTVLNAPGYELVTASSGEEALRWLLGNGEEIAVILLDVQMPDMDGFETANLIRTHERYRHVPIIFVTGIHGDPRLMTQGYEVGAIDYVTKPYQPFILRSKVSVLVDLHRKNRLIARMREREHQRVLRETTKRLEEEFSVRERRLIALVEHTTDFVAIAEPNFRVTFVNRAGQSLVGLPSEDSVDCTIFDFIAEGEHEFVRSAILKQILEMGAWEGELHFRHFETGAVIPVWSRAFAIRDPKTGEMTSLATVSRDITAQKQAERSLRTSERRFRTLTRFAPVGLFFTDDDGRLNFGNRRWFELVEVTEGQEMRAEPMAWLQHFHPDDRERVRQAWLRLAGVDEESGLQCRLVSAAGAERWVQLGLTVLHDADGAITGYIGSCVDVTDHVRNEERLQAAADALTRSNSDLERFAWVASHDLKEPIRMVANYVTLLDRKYADVLDADARKYIKYAVEGTQRMWALIDGILAFSGVGQSVRPMREVDTNDVFDTVVDNLQLVIQESGAVVKREALPKVIGDPAQLGQLFQNLIANSIKFRGEAPPVVETGVERDAGLWRFYVRDNGIGIDVKFHQQVFEVFRRLHTKTKYPGSGVGLAICKKIVEKHGGTMSVESKPGRGTTFYFTLPAAEAAVRPVLYPAAPHVTNVAAFDRT